MMLFVIVMMVELSRQFIWNINGALLINKE